MGWCCSRSVQGMILARDPEYIKHPGKHRPSSHCHPLPEQAPYLMATTATSFMGWSRMTDDEGRCARPGSSSQSSLTHQRPGRSVRWSAIAKTTNAHSILTSPE